MLFRSGQTDRDLAAFGIVGADREAVLGAGAGQGDLRHHERLDARCADLETLEKQVDKRRKAAKGDKSLADEVSAMEQAIDVLQRAGIPYVGGIPISTQSMASPTSFQFSVTCVLLFTVFRFSKVGIAMQASSQNQLAAYYMGIPVKRLNGLVWGLAAAVAAIAGPTFFSAAVTTSGLISSRLASSSRNAL